LYLSETVMSVPKMDTGESRKAMRPGFSYNENGSRDMLGIA
jgi:hypothetical protein